jgi:hypothetical protein
MAQESCARTDQKWPMLAERRWPDVTAILRTALRRLKSERDRVDRQIR